MKKTKENIWLYIIAGIVSIIVVPFALLYYIIKMIVIIPKYGFRMAYLKCWDEEKFKELEYEKDRAINSWPTDPVERAKMPRLKFRTDFQYEFSTYANMNPRELVYVASEQDAVLEDMLANNIDYFNQWAAPMHMRVLYLPSLFKDIANKDVTDYWDPSKRHNIVENSKIGNDYLLRYLIHPEDREIMKSGFLWSQNEVRSDHYVDTFPCYFLPLSSSSRQTIEQQLDNIKEKIRNEAWWLLPHVNCEVHNVGGKENDDFADNNFNSQYAFYNGFYDNTDDLIDEIKERISKLRKRGIAQHILEQLIQPTDEPSRMVLTKEFRIFLPGYNNMEIKMEPLVKAVYLLFLKHPEGILFKHLPDYRQELTEIYVKLKPNGLSDRVVQSIEDVTNPLLNSINEKCARIRGAFVGQFDDHLARHYYIDGLRGEAKKISLPRDKVVWEE